MTEPATSDVDDATERWLRPLRPSRGAWARLVCLPYAGGNATSFHTWAARLPRGVELLAAQYPGRHDRLTEPCLRTVPELADGLAPALAPLTDLPLFLFGHSLGAMIGYETAVRLEAGAGVRPAGLFVSGAYAPHRTTPYRARDDVELERDIRAAGWTDPGVLDVPELRAMILPLLMTDIRAATAYRRTDPVQLQCRVLAYGGSDDAAGASAELAAWGDLAAEPAGRRQFAGDHFYLRAHEAELVADLTARMVEWVGAPARGQWAKT